MKTVTAPTLATIVNDYHNEVGTVVIGEWNLNRYFRTVVDNTPAEDTDGYDLEWFPIDSITKSNRPTAGINKAVVGQASVSEDYHTDVPSARHYTIDRDDVYKYWQSPNTSAASASFAMTNCAPQVLYVEEDDVSGNPVPRLVTANKISFTVENTFAEPVTYNIQVKNTTGASWATVASNIAIPDNGQVQLWWNGSSWTTTKNLTSSRTVHAVRLQILNMDKEAYFNLIELGFRLELDLSADVATWSDTFDMGERDFITPLGTVSSNTANISFGNDDGKYSNDNPSSILYGLLDKGVLFTVSTKYGSELIREFTMFSDVWREEEGETTLNLEDGSKFFQETKPRPVLWRNIPVQEAIWRLCDICGFNNYEVTSIDDAPHSMLDIFWTDGQKSVWEVFSELSRGTQTAIYFDSFGTLQVKTREAAFRDDLTSSFNLTKESTLGLPSVPANIVTLTEETEYQPNKLVVNWTPTNFSEQRDNIIPMEVVWEPEGALTINASELTRPLLVGDMTVSIGPKQSAFWQYKGMFQIEGEFVSYEGKGYSYFDKGDQRAFAWVKSFEEQQALDSQSNPLLRHKNNYNGQLKITERGAWNSEERDHNIALTGWTISRQKGSGTITTPAPGVKLNEGQSTVTIAGRKNLTENMYTYLWRGNSIDVGYRYMGFRMKIDETGHKNKVGGMFFAADGGLGSGYYLDIMASARMNGTMRGKRNEVLFYSMKPDGSKKNFGGESIRLKNNDKGDGNANRAVRKVDIGARMLITQDRFIDFDIWFKKGAGAADDVIQIWANGKLLFIANVSGTWRHSNISRFGLYARGSSSATFEYVYGIYNTEGEPLDGESWYDRIEGGYRGDQWIEDWTYEVRQVRRRVRKKSQTVEQKYNQRFFDEFGPILHEVREFDVKFTSDTPVLQSRIYLSNTTQVVCPEYTGDNTGARFVLASISRTNAVVSGDDELTAEGAGTINHKVFVYGRPVIQKDPKKIERRDEWSIRRRGEIEIEYESPWTQNENAANNLIDWLVTRWPRSDSSLTLEIFGNPLLELGDVVHVDYNNIDDDYYVVNISNSFDQGLSTNLSLRKVG